jgi:hypothetical protein
MTDTKLSPENPKIPDNHLEKGLNESKLPDFLFTPPPPPPPPADSE